MSTATTTLNRSSASSARRHLPTLLALVLGTRALMFAVYLATGSWTAAGPTDPDWTRGTDGYVLLAQTLVESGRFAFGAEAPSTVHRAPAFPMAIALAYQVTRSFVWATVLVNVICSLVTAMLMFKTACLFYSARAAFWVALIGSFHPAMVRYTGSSFADTFLTATFITYAYTSLIAFRKRTWGWGVAAGLAFALTLLTKPILALLPIPALACALLFRRHWLRPLIVQYVVAVVALIPWTVRNYPMVHRPTAVAVGGGFNLLVGNFMVNYHSGNCNNCFHTAVRDALDYVEKQSGTRIVKDDLRPNMHLDITADQDKLFFKHAVAQLRADPMWAVRKVVINLGRFWYFASLPQKCLVLGAINIPIVILAAWEWIRRRRSHADAITWLALMVVYTWFTYAAIIVHSRFYLALMPLLLPFALIRAGKLISRLRSSRRPA